MRNKIVDTKGQDFNDLLSKRISNSPWMAKGECDTLQLNYKTPLITSSK